MNFKINDFSGKEPLLSYSGIKNTAKKITINSALAKFDKDVRDFIVNNTLISVGMESYKLRDLSKKTNIKFSLFKDSLICLAEVLQKMKKEDPDLFLTLKNLKNESHFAFRLHLCEKDWIRYGEESNLGNYDGVYFNVVNLQAFKLDPGTYYHEIIHAIDDGKLIAKGAQVKIDLDYLSSNPEIPDLVENISNYREKLMTQWNTDIEEFNAYRIFSKYKDKNCGLYDICRKEEKVFAKKYWFYQYGFLETICNNEEKGNKLSPPALKNNRELIAWALEYLKYGAKEQQNMIKNDKELMRIIKQWKKFTPLQIK